MKGIRLTDQEIEFICELWFACNGNASEVARRSGYARSTVIVYLEAKGLLETNPNKIVANKRVIITDSERLNKNASQAARALHISPSTVYRAWRAKNLPIIGKDRRLQLVLSPYEPTPQEMLLPHNFILQRLSPLETKIIEEIFIRGRKYFISEAALIIYAQEYGFDYPPMSLDSWVEHITKDLMCVPPQNELPPNKIIRGKDLVYKVFYFDDGILIRNIRINTTNVYGKD